MSECFECGEPAMYMHHVVPRILGGTKMVPLCSKCHAKVHGTKLYTMQELARKALDAKRGRNEWMGGPTPYGWRIKADGLHLEAHPGEQLLLVEAQRLRREGRTLRQVGESLTEQGLYPRNGGVWHSQSVANLLRGTVAA
jgi:hypothetical protein